MLIHSLFGEDYSCNSFLLINEETAKALVIDPGLNGKKIINYLQKNNLELENILLTHGHFDHIQDISLLKEKYPHIKVFLHELEEDFLINERLNCSFFVRANYKVIINVETHTLKDNDIISFNNYGIQTLHTPFHTRGSVCYYIKDLDALFSGDTLFKNSIGRTDLPTSAPRLIAKSLSIIESLPLKTIVYPGHGPLSNISDERKHNYFLQRKDGI